MSDAFELVSLSGRGRAEIIRLLLIASDIPFIDHRITLSQWKDYRRKEFLPEDTKLPLLRINKKRTVVGSTDICRMISEQNGYYGDSKADQHEIDEIISDVDYLHQNLTPVIRAVLSKNFIQKREAWNEYRSTTLNPVLERLTARLENKTFFVGNKISWADIAVAEMLSRFANCFDSNFIHSHPILKTHMQAIERFPTLRRYISDRPASLY